MPSLDGMRVPATKIIRDRKTKSRPNADFGLTPDITAMPSDERLHLR